MVAAIPASAIVNVTPNVIDAGGSGLDMIGLMLTNSTRPPTGSVLSLSTLSDVGTYFGASSTEYALAQIYFAGYSGSAIKPAALLFYQYPAAAVPAYLRGGNVSALTLAQLQAIGGTITLTIDGRSVTSGTINLSAVASFSAAATAIQTALNDQDASFTGVIAVTTGILTASSTTGTIAVGQTITGAGVPAGTIITGFISGTGSNGTYQTNITTAVSSTSMKSGPTLVTYDSTSGAFIVTAGTPGATGSITVASGSAATGLKLTAATGAVTSQGAAAGVPGNAMDAVYAQTQNFVSFMTAFQPSTSDMLAFAAWNNGKQSGTRFIYAMSDASAAPTTTPDTTSVGYQIAQLGYAGTAPIYDPANAISVAAFLMGAIASVDFSRTNARVTMAFRSGSGLTAGVTNKTIADALIANGYNFYGRYATANDANTFFYPGHISGDFRWIDSDFNQVWLNNAFQLALMDLLTSVGTIPYNAAGFSLIEAALADPINAALSFGAIQPGVALSAEQAAEVNTAAGLIVSDAIQQRGWYLQVAAPTAAVRASRGTPVCNFFYTDGQSVQTINLSSVLIQ